MYNISQPGSGIQPPNEHKQHCNLVKIVNKKAVIIYSFIKLFVIVSIAPRKADTNYGVCEEIYIWSMVNIICGMFTAYANFMFIGSNTNNAFFAMLHSIFTITWFLFGNTFFMNTSCTGTSLYYFGVYLLAVDYLYVLCMIIWIAMSLCCNRITYIRPVERFIIESGIQQVINEYQLRRYKYQVGETAVACSVCITDLMTDDNVVHLNCDHIFHEMCIMPWLNQRMNCPNCRQVVEGDIRHIQP